MLVILLSDVSIFFLFLKGGRHLFFCRKTILVAAIFNRILFIFTGNEDMCKSLNEFEIWPDATTGFHGNHRVIMGKMLCPL